MFGQKLRAIRRQQDITQRTLAERSGVTQGRIAQLERLQKNPRQRIVQRLASALGVQVESLEEV